jgi:hypothetical protein
MRALAREAGMAVEVRLGPRDERIREFESGQTDVMFLSYNESARAISTPRSNLDARAKS